MHLFKWLSRVVNIYRIDINWRIKKIFVIRIKNALAGAIIHQFILTLTKAALPTFTVTKIMYRYYAVYYKRQDSSSIHTCLSNYGCSWRHAHYRVTLNLTYQNLTISPVEKSSGRLFILLERELIEKTYVIITPVSI